MPKRESQQQERLIRLNCYNELDASFIDNSLLFRLTTGRNIAVTDRACLIRIPTHSRLTFERLHFTSKMVMRRTFTSDSNIPCHFQSSVTILAGSSPIYLPLRTEDVHAGELGKYGPWHVPCQSAYLVLRPRGNGPEPEWVEYRLSPETAGDRLTEWTEECRSDAKNYAAEYGPSMEESGER